VAKTTPFKYGRTRIVLHKSDDEVGAVTAPAYLYREDLIGIDLAVHREVYYGDDGDYHVRGDTWTVTEPTSGGFIVTSIKTREEAVKHATLRLKDYDSNTIMDALFKLRTTTGDVVIEKEIEGEDHE
jgi:hypothetical protein